MNIAKEYAFSVGTVVPGLSPLVLVVVGAAVVEAVVVASTACTVTFIVAGLGGGGFPVICTR